MALESATYISQLVPSNPTITDPVAQFYAHVNLIKQVAQNQFPNLGTAAVTATAASINSAAAAFANGTITAIQSNGTVASAELDLLGLINAGGTHVAGRVEFLNTATAGQSGALSILMTNSLDASPVTALSLTSDGTLTATGPVNASSVRQAGNPLIPSGLIVMWNSTVASIPAGWVLCDGTNGTPDLRNRFIVGAGTGTGGSSYTPSATGGAVSVTASTDTQGAHNHGGQDALAGSHNHGGNTGSYALQVGDLAAHSHSVSVTDPGHTHTPGVGAGAFVTLGSGGTLASGGTFGVTTTPATAGSTTGISVTEASVGSGNSHSHGITADGTHQHSISADGNHSHSVTVATLPPYYALCYIQKT